MRLANEQARILTIKVINSIYLTISFYFFHCRIVRPMFWIWIKTVAAFTQLTIFMLVLLLPFFALKKTAYIKKSCAIYRQTGNANLCFLLLWKANLISSNQFTYSAAIISMGKNLMLLQNFQLSWMQNHIKSICIYIIMTSFEENELEMIATIFQIYLWLHCEPYLLFVILCWNFHIWGAEH